MDQFSIKVPLLRKQNKTYSLHRWTRRVKKKMDKFNVQYVKSGLKKEVQ